MKHGLQKNDRKPGHQEYSSNGMLVYGENSLALSTPQMHLMNQFPSTSDHNPDMGCIRMSLATSRMRALSSALAQIVTFLTHTSISTLALYVVWARVSAQSKKLVPTFFALGLGNSPRRPVSNMQTSLQPNAVFSPCTTPSQNGLNLGQLQVICLKSAFGSVHLGYRRYDHHK